jgi:hypothetical protein
MIEHPREPAPPPSPLTRATQTARKAAPPAASLAVILIVLGIVFRHSVHWGDIPTWTLATSTLLAFLAAGFAGLVGYELLKIEAARDRQAAHERALAADERERDHARHISFWVTLSQAKTKSGYDPLAPYVGIVLHIVNTSDQPAMAALALAGIRGDVWRDASTADQKKLQERGAEWSAPAIPPGDRLDIRIEIQVPDSVAQIVGEYGDNALIGELMFTDANATAWAKTYPDGQLLKRQSPAWSDHIHLSLAQRDEQRRNPSEPNPPISPTHQHSETATANPSH